MHPHASAARDWANTIDLMDRDTRLEMLMARYQAGDFAAAAALVDCISPQLHRFFVTQRASRAEADDLLQETWLSIHKVRHTYRPGEPVLPWFYAIARHIRVDHYRKAMRSAVGQQRLADMPKVAAASQEESARASRLQSLLAILPESQREVLVMLKVAGMSLQEVARATSSSVGSVKQKVHRAYKKLREEMGDVGLAKNSRGGQS